jgi:beta-phosphoglucomutase family hydrolase
MGGDDVTVAELPDLFDGKLQAFLFDLDGVITHTADVHAEAWKELFDEFLASREGDPARLGPFELPDDYITYVDGKPRYEGVRSFLASRGIELPWGDPSDPPDAPTVCGLGNRKNDFFNQALEEHGVTVFESSVALVRALRAAGIACACVSSSKNCRPILARAGLSDLFDVIFDGVDAERDGIEGKPTPGTYLHAAHLLGVPAARAVVIEDAVSGVQAGRAGEFGLVLGVDRGAGVEALRENGADVVVDDLGAFAIPAEFAERP